MVLDNTALESALDVSEDVGDAINTLKGNFDYAGERLRLKNQLRATKDQKGNRSDLVRDYARVLAFEQILEGLSKYQSNTSGDAYVAKEEMFRDILWNINQLEREAKTFNEDNQIVSAEEALDIKQQALDLLRSKFRNNKEYLKVLDNVVEEEKAAV